jgi:hypothetical protein
LVHQKCQAGTVIGELSVKIAHGEPQVLRNTLLDFHASIFARYSTCVKGIITSELRIEKEKACQFPAGFSASGDSARTTTTRVKKENVIQSEASESLRRLAQQTIKPRVEEPALSEGPARDRIERDLHFAQTHKACWDLGAPIVPPFLTRHAHIGQAHLVPRKRDYGESHGLQAVE